jgi:hypothetical protein
MGHRTRAQVIADLTTAAKVRALHKTELAQLDRALHAEAMKTAPISLRRNALVRERLAAKPRPYCQDRANCRIVSVARSEHCRLCNALKRRKLTAIERGTTG